MLSLLAKRPITAPSKTFSPPSPVLLCLTGGANAEVANKEEQTQCQEQTKKNEVDEAQEYSHGSANFPPRSPRLKPPYIL